MISFNISVGWLISRQDLKTPDDEEDEDEDEEENEIIGRNMLNFGFEVDMEKNNNSRIESKVKKII